MTLNADGMQAAFCLVLGLLISAATCFAMPVVMVAFVIWGG